MGSGICLILFGIFAGWIGGVFQKRIPNKTKTIGEIVESKKYYDETDHIYRHEAIVEFYHNDQKYSCECKGLSINSDVGSKVNLVYNAENPEQVRKQSDIAPHILMIGLILFGIYVILKSYNII